MVLQGGVRIDGVRVESVDHVVVPGERVFRWESGALCAWCRQRRRGVRCYDS